MENTFLDDHVGAGDEDESDTPHHFLFHAIGYGGAAGWNFMVLPKYLFSTNIKISSHVGGSRYAGSSLPAGTRFSPDLWIVRRGGKGGISVLGLAALTVVLSIALPLRRYEKNE